MPIAQKIQPSGFRGRRAATTAPTSGKVIAIRAIPTTPTSVIWWLLSDSKTRPKRPRVRLAPHSSQARPADTRGGIQGRSSPLIAAVTPGSISLGPVRDHPRRRSWFWWVTQAYLVTVSPSLRARMRSEPIAHGAGGEQAADALQPDNTSRHATTANAKVTGAIEALLLVMGRPCLRSHSRGPVPVGWRRGRAAAAGSPDPGAVDYQSAELQSASRLWPSRWVQRRSLGSRVGTCLQWPLACPLDDGVHLLSVEGLHGLGPDAAGGGGLEQHGGGRLV